MTFADFALWFGALMFLIIIAEKAIDLAKFASQEEDVTDWGSAVLLASAIYALLVTIVLAFTYGLVTR